MASDHKTKIFVAALLLALVFSSPSNGAEVTQRTVILSTTTSTQDSGLLDVLIPLFEKQTGYSVLVNTSFNVRGEPIVNTPEDSYRCFMRTDMDYLVVGNLLFDKKLQPEWKEKDDWRKEFTLD